MKKENIRGASGPSVKMGGWPANTDGRPAMGVGHPASLVVGRPSPVRQGSSSAHGRGVQPARALSPRPTIRKEHRSITPTCSMTGVLSPRKVTVQRRVAVSPSSSDDDLPLVKHDAQVDLNPGGAQICYTQEPTPLMESPSHSPPPYIVSGWWRALGHGKVLIQNPNYEEKGHMESASSNPAPRVGWRPPPPKIRSPPGTMKFSNVETKEEKEEPFDKLVVTLK
jgi:hypothetical protein